MAQAPRYQRTKDFGADYPDQTDNQAINNELDAVAQTTDGLRANLAKVQRDDGSLRDGIVTKDALAQPLKQELYDEFSQNVTAAVETAQQAAGDANIAAQAAANSATNAATSAADAAGSLATIAGAVTSTTASANAAAISATSASNSETNAATSATQALASKNAAAASEGNAAGSALTATGAANSASDSRDASAASAAQALASKNAAAASEGNAATSAAAAENSETAAADWAARAEAVEGRWMPLGSTMSWPGLRTSIPGGFIPRDGQEVPQSLYPDFYALLVAGAFPVTDEATWQSTPSIRGCFVLESSPGNFRMPDWNGKSPGAIDRVFVGGDGGSAAAAGVIQEDAFQNITGKITGRVSTPDPNVASGAFSGTVAPHNTTAGASLNGCGWNNLDFNAANSPGARTAPRTRPVNVAGVWITKVADVATNPGTVDIVALAAQASAIGAGLQTLDGELDFTIVYPNEGTAAAPANVATNSRYVEVNPFPGYNIFCRPQILKSGKWADHWFASSGTSGYGISAGLFGPDLIVQTGSGGVSGTSSTIGSLTSEGSSLASAPCRVLVWKLKGAIT